MDISIYRTSVTFFNLTMKNSTIDYILEGVLIVITIMTAVILFIHFDDMAQKHVHPLDKYDSITAKVPVEERIVNFNDVPKRKYYDKDGILTIEY